MKKQKEDPIIIRRNGRRKPDGGEGGGGKASKVDRGATHSTTSHSTYLPPSPSLLLVTYAFKMRKAPGGHAFSRTRALRVCYFVLRAIAFVVCYLTLQSRCRTWAGVCRPCLAMCKWAVPGTPLRPLLPHTAHHPLFHWPFPSSSFFPPFPSTY